MRSAGVVVTDSASDASSVTLSVSKAFAGDPVLLFDRIGPYRPDNLAKHIDFKQYFGADATGKPVLEPQCVADDIEAKWEKAGYPGRL